LQDSAADFTADVLARLRDAIPELSRCFTGFRKTVLLLQRNLNRIGLRLGFRIQKSIELGAPVGILSQQCDNRQICRGLPSKWRTIDR